MYINKPQRHLSQGFIFASLQSYVSLFWFVDRLKIQESDPHIQDFHPHLSYVVGDKKEICPFFQSGHFLKLHLLCVLQCFFTWLSMLLPLCLLRCRVSQILYHSKIFLGHTSNGGLYDISQNALQIYGYGDRYSPLASSMLMSHLVSLGNVSYLANVTISWCYHQQEQNSSGIFLNLIDIEYFFPAVMQMLLLSVKILT